MLRLCPLPWFRGVWNVLSPPLTLGLAMGLAVANDVLLDMTPAEAEKVPSWLDLPPKHLSITDCRLGAAGLGGM